MPNTLDLNLMVIARQAGMDLVDLPDLYIAEPPRSPARGREADRLVLFLAITGQPPDPTERPSQILSSLAGVFYKTPGSVTSALRQVIGTINDTFYQRNLSAAEGSQSFARLVCFVLRGDQAYLAHAGPAKTLVIGAQESQEYLDPDLSSLGMHETPDVRFFQATLQPNDSLLIAAQPPANWTLENLRISHGQGPESIRRRLLGGSSLDLNAILIQARPGKGSITQLRSAPVQATATGAAMLAPQADDLAEAAIPAQTWTAEAPLPEAAAAAVVTEGFTPWNEIPASSAGKSLQESPAAHGTLPAVVAAAGVAEPPSAEEYQPVPGSETAAQAPRRYTLTGCLLAPFLWLGGLLSSLVSGLAHILQVVLSRLLPEDSLASISNTGMAAVALIIPVVVVAISSFFYFQRGLGVESQMAFQEAAQAAQLAREQTDPVAQRQAWEETLQILNQVSASQTTPQASELRNEVATSLDALNQVRRVDYQPAIVGGLPANVKIIRIVSTGDNLYLLDGNSSSVLRASYTAQGYVLDVEFQCFPNTPSQVGPLLDMLPGSSNSESPSDILTLDPKGNLLYCQTDSVPNLQTLQPPAARSFAALQAFTEDLNYLYVLDPPANAVWVYPANNLSQEPRLYFDEYTPPMQDTIDLATASDELYLLHADGHLTLCQTSNLDVSPTRCTEPAPFLDSRPGLEELPLVPVNPYTQIEYSQPPDPALYLLEPTGQAVDLFSLQRLTYQRRYLPVNALAGGAATAFTIDPVNRIIFLAAGNSVYYGRIP